MFICFIFLFLNITSIYCHAPYKCFLNDCAFFKKISELKTQVSHDRKEITKEDVQQITLKSNVYFEELQEYYVQLLPFLMLLAQKDTDYVQTCIVHFLKSELKDSRVRYQNAVCIALLKTLYDISSNQFKTLIIEKISNWPITRMVEDARHVNYEKFEETHRKWMQEFFLLIKTHLLKDEFSIYIKIDSDTVISLFIHNILKALVQLNSVSSIVFGWALENNHIDEVENDIQMIKFHTRSLLHIIMRWIEFCETCLENHTYRHMSHAS